MFDELRSLLDNPLFKSQVRYSTKTYGPQNIILHEGKHHTNFYIIKKGGVKVVVHGHRAETEAPIRPAIADLGPEDIFGEFSIFDNEPASADVVTKADTELVEIDIKSFQTFLEKNPAIGYKVLLEMLHILVKRLRHADKSMHSLLVWGMKIHKIDEHLS